MNIMAQGCSLMIWVVNYQILIQKQTLITFSSNFQVGYRTLMGFIRRNARVWKLHLGKLLYISEF